METLPPGASLLWPPTVRCVDQVSEEVTPLIPTRINPGDVPKIVWMGHRIQYASNHPCWSFRKQSLQPNMRFSLGLPPESIKTDMTRSRMHLPHLPHLPHLQLALPPKPSSKLSKRQPLRICSHSKNSPSYHLPICASSWRSGCPGDCMPWPGSSCLPVTQFCGPATKLLMKGKVTIDDDNMYTIYIYTYVFVWKCVI